MKTLNLTQLWLRNLIYWALLLVSTTLCTCCLLLSAPLPRRRRHVFGQFWARFQTWALANVVGLRYRVIGLENIPSVPSIICSKHQSGWETMALQAIFPAQIYVAKRELLWIPVFGWGFAMMNPITIDRSNATRSTQQIVRQGRERKAHGFWITVFPEGTRIAPGERGKYKLGAARMSKLLDMPLVPVAHNAGEFWPRNAFLKHPGLITVVIGAPVTADASLPADQQMAQVEDWIEARQEEIGGVGPCAPQSLRDRRAQADLA
jgi:1-acyl-sn-glycerol-3-phosphate acyltransferase